MISTVAMLCMVALHVVSAPSAAAVGNTCRATNLTQGTPSRSNLQAAINAAHPGDRISVEGVCVGSFTIDRNLTLVGQHDARTARNPSCTGNAVRGVFSAWPPG